MKIDDKKFDVLFDKKEIERRIHKISKKIQHDFHGEELTIICILKGAFIFTSDLIRHFDSLKCNINFIQISSYENETESSGNVKLISDLNIDIKGKNILIVEDIIDSGLSLNYLTKMLNERQPKKLKTCVFIDKKSRRKFEFNPDYVCFDLEEDLFVIGYGLDYQNNYRNLDEVYFMDESRS